MFVGVIASCLLLAGVFWGMACACRQSKKPHKRQKVQKYALIGTQDEEAANCEFKLIPLLKLKSYNYASFTRLDSRNTSLTESETDSDVLFETRSKSNGIAKHKGHHNSSSQGSSGREGNKYAITKLGRKIKA